MQDTARHVTCLYLLPHHQFTCLPPAGLLDKETWAAAAVTVDVQAIVNDLAARASAGPASPGSRQQDDAVPATNGHSIERLRIGSEAFCMVRPKLRWLLGRA